MTIQQLVKTCHKNAKDKGFWDSNSHNIPEKLMLIVSELGEALEALREGKRQPNKENADELNTKTGKIERTWFKDTFEDEICDVVIRIADLCGWLNINLDWQIKKKLEYNKNRSYKHGKKF